MRKSVMLWVLLAAGCATTQVAVPEALRAPPGQSEILVAQARGVQVYVCKAGKDPATQEWTLKGPDAELFDRGGAKIGKHYDGPTWEASDGSKVVGEVKAKDPGHDPTAIPWLLLNAKSAEGEGVLARTATIQRLETVGGKAPADGCSPATLGATVRVAYQAVYRFYR